MCASMPLCNFHQIEQHRDRDTILLKVDSHSNIGLVIRGRPSVSRKVQCSIVVLVCIIISISCLSRTDQSTYI